MQCRFCGNKKDEKSMTDLFGADGLFDGICSLLPIKVSAKDPYTKLACCDCIQHIQDWQNFITVCRLTETKLREGNNENEDKNADITVNDILDIHNYAETVKRNVFCMLCNKDIVSNKCEEHQTQHCSEKLSGYTCFICYLSMINIDDLDNHFKGHYCSSCSSYMKNKNEHQCLVMKNQRTTMFTCRFCKQQVTDLTKHSLLHVKDNQYHCIVCESNYGSEEELLTHYKSHTKLFRCTDCKHAFRCQYRLDIHQKYHTSDVNNCDICSKTFSNEVHLYKHMMYNHLNRKTYNCHICVKVFNNKSSLNYHLRSHTSLEAMKPFTCDICKKRFARENILRDHLRNVHESGDIKQSTCFQCKICHECFPNTKSAISHMDLQHLIQVEQQTGYKLDMLTISKLYICEFCERVFSSGSLLMEHSSLHNSYECKYCTTQINDHEELITHMKQHDGDQVEFPVPSLYFCQYCEKCYKDYEQFYLHRNRHLTTNSQHPYSCQFCCQVFTNYQSLTEHKVTHNKNNKTPDCLKPFECSQCEKAFMNASSLKKHLRIHTGERPFDCKICGKKFTQSSGLYTHYKVHSDDKPYKCDLCERSFKIIGDYKLHVRKHSGLRPYKCDYCSKQFTSQQTYSQHRSIHTQGSTFVCDICNAIFHKAGALKQHQLKHNNCVCQYCKKDFKLEEDLVNHLKQKHGQLDTDVT